VNVKRFVHRVNTKAAQAGKRLQDRLNSGGIRRFSACGETLNFSANPCALQEFCRCWL
jgi:hypothetical protein